MKLAMTGGETVSSRDLKNCVLYFYPRDNTPGCTQEGKDFADLYPKFKKLGFAVYGVSNDTLASHEKFTAKFDFPFPLISDPEKELSTKFDVIKMKSMYGKKFEGIERSTFVLGEKGKVLKEWHKLKVPGHVKEVLDFLETL